MDLRNRSVLLTGAGTGIAGPQHGSSYETPDEVAAATLAGIADGSLVVVRRGDSQAQTVALNRQDPAALDAALGGLKPEPELAVAGHSSL